MRRISKVKRAKWLTLIAVIISLISIKFMWNLNKDITQNPEDLKGFYLFVAIFLTFMMSFMIFVALHTIIWLRVQTYRIKLNLKRYAYHYNRTIKAFEDNDYDKVIYIYRNRFENDEEHKNQTEKFLFAYNVINNNNLMVYEKK